MTFSSSLGWLSGVAQRRSLLIASLLIWTNTPTGPPTPARSIVGATYPFASWSYPARLRERGVLNRIRSDPAFAWAMELNLEGPVDLKNRRIGPVLGSLVPSVWSCDPPMGSATPYQNVSCLQQTVRGDTFRWFLDVRYLGKAPFIWGHQERAPGGLIGFGLTWPTQVPVWLPGAGVLGETQVLAKCNLDLSIDYAWAMIFFKSQRSKAEVIHALREHLLATGAVVEITEDALSGVISNRMQLGMNWVDGEDGPEYGLQLLSIR